MGVSGDKRGRGVKREEEWKEGSARRRMRRRGLEERCGKRARKRRVKREEEWKEGSARRRMRRRGLEERSGKRAVCYLGRTPSVPRGCPSPP